ncbi:hypothetical protein BU24DRAFT_459794 [Aaosphaeria arxii CBS 175.79]|uniref:C2H2-type domain-containing protein n=1 Tax=Aaosphaeria arxii CBS 175.79 TaxID=1450172 RepID=A0A6A5Y569_9PLEO|nr:uncharacterized protein BU24DRAFT_459794 [Aaosphaeria arxii CBS 175.79]KAF2020187.1 hypothetical protein BU24DRAFT_459794 [Aaosphaeria arxii CBS 175.79]
MSYSQYPGGADQYTTGYSAPIPQYTESQIHAYYQQYQCYPQQPYHVIPDYFPQPVYTTSQYPVTTQGGYYPHEDPMVSLPEPHKLAPPEDDEMLRRRRSMKADRRSRSRSASQPRTFPCTVPNCTSTANFTRLADLQRHQSTVHNKNTTPEYPCEVKGCTRIGDKGFTRRDHLVEHLRNFHHIDIPKRKPGERSANPLGRSLTGYSS